MDYYPVVKTVSAVVQQDGSVKVTGEIVKQGADAIEYAGFSMDTVSIPAMVTNQMLTNTLQSNQFFVIYPQFELNKRYYFRSFATNGYGYSYGNVIYLDSIKATPLIAPCTPAMNSLDWGAGGGIDTYTSIAAPSYGVNSYDFETSSNAGTIYFHFGSLPVTKIYTTVTYDTPGANEAYIYFYSGFTSATLNPGSLVYVNQLNPNKWEMTICDAPWTTNGATFHLRTKFVCPL